MASALTLGLALTAALALAAIAVSGCGAGSSAGETEAALAPGAPVKIGYLASLTGYCAPLAREYVAGAELAVREIDAHGGVDGHRLRLIVRDDRATPSVGVARARALVQGEHVKFLAGTCSSAVGESVAQLVANPAHVIYAAGVSTPAAVAGGRQVYAFDTIPTATVEGRNAAAYVRAHPQWRRIGVIGEDFDYGHWVTAAFARALASDRRGSAGGQRIVSVQYLPSGGRDYTPYIRRLLAARPQAIYSTMIEGDAVRLVGQGLGLGLFAGGRSFLGVMDYGTLRRMAAPPVGVEGYTVYPSASIYKTPFARELMTLGRPIAGGGAAGDAFNQIELIAQGIAKARSTDPTKVRDALSGAVVQTVQGEARIDACDHVLGTPIAMGPVVGPSAGAPYARLQPVELMGTGKYAEC